MTRSSFGKNQNNTVFKRHYVARFYITLSVIAVAVMIIAAFITYGYQQREVRIAYNDQSVLKAATSQNVINVSPDLSRVPSDKVIEDILNDVLPDVCDDCDDDPLECLEESLINKVVVANEEYQDQLLIEVITGRSQKKYTVVIDLRSNAVVSQGGAIDEKECFDPVEEEVDPEVLLNPGIDPDDSKYVNVPPPQ